MTEEQYRAMLATYGIHPSAGRGRWIGGTCSECRYWRNSDYGVPYGYCGFPKSDDEYWPRDGMNPPDDPFAAVRTGPDFACIHWSEKP